MFLQGLFPWWIECSGSDARVIFLAKDGPVGRSVTIPDETSCPNHTSGGRYVVRYGNGSRGQRQGVHWTRWLPGEAAKVRAFVAAEDKR